MPREGSDYKCSTSVRLYRWPRRESNPHGGYPPTDFKCRKSATVRNRKATEHGEAGYDATQNPASLGARATGGYKGRIRPGLVVFCVFDLLHRIFRLRWVRWFSQVWILEPSGQLFQFSQVRIGELVSILDDDFQFRFHQGCSRCHVVSFHGGGPAPFRVAGFCGGWAPFRVAGFCGWWAVRFSFLSPGPSPRRSEIVWAGRRFKTARPPSDA